MTVELIRDVLGWCTLINISLFLTWFLMFSLAHDFVFNLHRRWFNLSLDHFDAIHYAAMAIFKMAIIFFNLVPYIALRIAG